MFGSRPAYAPALWLWLVWLAITILRCIPASYSLWEDPLWCLVTKINQSWRVALGFTWYDVDHILYGSLSRLIIKATGHHWIEVTYRIPSLVAGALVLPLGFGAFSRIRGPLCGTLFSLSTVLLPVFTLYADDARGYMILVAGIIWAIGLLADNRAGSQAIRLGCAYFIIGTSHGLGLMLVGCFAAVGSFIDQGHRPSIRTILKNGLAAVPVYLYNLPMFIKLFRWRHYDAVDTGMPPLQITTFMIDWFEYLFGSSFLPWLSIAALLLIITGCIATARRSWPSAGAFVILGLFIPVLFIVSGSGYTLERYSMLCVPFWLYLLCAGCMAIADHFSSVRSIRPIILGGYALLLLRSAPVLTEYIRYPQQDYRGAYSMISREYPEQKRVWGFSSAYQTGLSFYARQFNLEYIPYDSLPQLNSTAWVETARKIVIIPDETEVRPEMLDWVKRHSVKETVFKGTALPTRVFVVEDFADGRESML